MPVMTTPRTLDARTLPGHVRREAVLSGFDALLPGEALIVTTGDEPSPLLAQLQAERKGLFEWSPLEQGPAQWRTEIARRQAAPGARRDVTEALAWDHDRLERIEARAFESRSAGDLAAARAGFGEFALGLRRHIGFEERILFPEFEQRTGLDPHFGPTAVMRAEHREIERLLGEISVAIGVSGSSAEALRGELQSVLSAHNVKEERVLYPGTDELLAQGERDALVARIQAS